MAGAARATARDVTDMAVGSSDWLGPRSELESGIEKEGDALRLLDRFLFIAAAGFVRG